MRFSTKESHALTRLLAATAVAVTLGAGHALAAGDGGSWRYDRYLKQEQAREAARQTVERNRSRGDQRATIGADEDGGFDAYSGIESSPYHFRNAEQHSRGR